MDPAVQVPRWRKLNNIRDVVAIYTQLEEESKVREWGAIHTGFAVFFRDLLISEPPATQ